jgi:uncharacterized protein YjbJ (UPF0337 family)
MPPARRSVIINFKQKVKPDKAKGKIKNAVGGIKDTVRDALDLDKL